MSMGRLFLVEGNIGTGKSTFADKMGKKLNAKVFFEPTTTNPYLELFYADPEKYALRLQLWIYRQRLTIYIEAVKHLRQTGDNVILDRSVYSDVVFALANHEATQITDEGLEHYSKLRANSLLGAPLPHVVVVLRASPSVVLERIKARSRNCETGIPISYLELLEKNLSLWADKMSALVGPEVLSLDWEQFPTPEEEEVIFQQICNAAHNCHCWNEKELEWLPTSKRQEELLLQISSENVESLLEKKPSEPSSALTGHLNISIADANVIEAEEQLKTAKKRPRPAQDATPTDLDRASKQKKKLIFFEES